jgi:hypothetical protein
MNSEGSPSDTVAGSYVWAPGTEIAAPLGAELLPRGNGHAGNGQDRGARPRSRGGKALEARA